MYKQKKKIKPYEVSVAEFKGLCRLPIVEENEVKVSTNMVFDKYPVMSVRGGRTLVQTVTSTPQAIISTGDKLAWVAGNTLYYDGAEASGLTLSDGGKSMVEFWGKIFIFPDAKYYDITTGAYGNIGTGTYITDGSCPDMDYVVVHNNRIWGCKGNHIYASTLGNAMGDSNPASVGPDKKRSEYGWTYFIDPDGNPAEGGSFALDCSIDGDFKGIASWDSRIVLLGERNHIEVFGDYPSNFSLRSITKHGTVNHASMKEVNSILFYVSNIGALQYTGGVEKEISRKLNEVYHNAIGGTDGIRYYICLDNGEEKKVYMHHTLLGCWTEEGVLDVVNFVQHQGFMYALCADGKLLKFNDPKSTERVHWQFEFDDYSPAIYNNTVIRNLKLKVKSTDNSYLKVEVSVDGKEWETKKEITSPNKALQSVNIGLDRGSEHRFRISGEGAIDIYGYQFTFMDGGDKV